MRFLGINLIRDVQEIFLREIKDNLNKYITIPPS